MVRGLHYLTTLPDAAPRCHGYGCGLRTDCLRHRLRHQEPAPPVLGLVCKDPETREGFLLAPPQPQQFISTTTRPPMESSLQEITPIIGTALAGGFYAGRIRIGDQLFALIVAPKAEGEAQEMPWNNSRALVDGAQSFNDGMANTQAMAAAGSALAKWARMLRIGGHDDWYLPSQDELEICYRNLKPTTEENTCLARSGINLSAVEPTRPYTPTSPVQTYAELFQGGGAEAFADEWYWSSTQHASDSDYAWLQNFYYGCQDYGHKSYEGRARAVRRLPI